MLRVKVPRSSYLTANDVGSEHLSVLHRQGGVTLHKWMPPPQRGKNSGARSASSRGGPCACATTSRGRCCPWTWTTTSEEVEKITNCLSWKRDVQAPNGPLSGSRNSGARCRHHGSTTGTTDARLYARHPWCQVAGSPLQGLRSSPSDHPRQRHPRCRGVCHQLHGAKGGIRTGKRIIELLIELETRKWPS